MTTVKWMIEDIGTNRSRASLCDHLFKNSRELTDFRTIEKP